VVAAHADWAVVGIPIGLGLVVFTLIAEGALLFVAAQTGFVAGPATLGRHGRGRVGAEALRAPLRAARDPERHHHDGLAAIATIVYSAGAVKLLIVMYSINVFLTFTLSQLAWCATGGRCGAPRRTGGGASCWRGSARA
jgi:hypothetical protein